MKTRICTVCNIEKSIWSFRNGISTCARCKECRIAHRHAPKNTKQKKHTGTSTGREWSQDWSYAKHVYGLDEFTCEAMYQAQEGKCAICGKADMLVIDHNHKTSKVRGLLCRACNTGIGLLQDSSTILEMAAMYINNGL